MRKALIGLSIFVLAVTVESVYLRAVGKSDIRWIDLVIIGWFASWTLYTELRATK